MSPLSKNYFENKINSTNSPNSKMDIWKRYLTWNLEKDSGNFSKLIARSLSDMHKLYKLGKITELNFIDFWMNLSIMFPSRYSLSIFPFLYKRNVGVKSSLFYSVWAKHAIKNKNKELAINILNLGISNNAQPIEDLKSTKQRLEEKQIEQKIIFENVKRGFSRVFYTEESPISFEELRAQDRKHLYISPKKNTDDNNTQKQLSNPYSELENSDSFFSDHNNSKDSIDVHEKNKDFEEKSPSSFSDQSNTNFNKETYDEEEVRQIIENDTETLSVPTKTISYNFERCDSLIKTPVPRKLFDGENRIFSTRKETDTFIMAKNEFLKTVRKNQKNDNNKIKKIKNGVVRKKVLNPLSKKAREKFVKNNVENEHFNLIKHLSFKQDNNLREFAEISKLKKVKLCNVSHRVTKVINSSQAANFFLFTNKETKEKDSHYRLEFSQNILDLKYQAYVASILTSNLNNQEINRFIFPEKLYLLGEGIHCLVTKFPKNVISLAKVFVRKSIDEKFVAFIAHQMCQTVFTLHKAGLVYGNIVDSTFVFSNLSLLFKTNIWRSKNWDEWYAVGGLRMILAPNCFSRSSFPTKNFMFDKTSSENVCEPDLNQPVEIRNKSSWNFEIDGIGICTLINRLLNKNQLLIAYLDNSYYRPVNLFQPGIDQDLWADVFYLLLNLEKETDGLKLICEKIEKFFKTCNINSDIAFSLKMLVDE